MNINGNGNTMTLVRSQLRIGINGNGNETKVGEEGQDDFSEIFGQKSTVKILHNNGYGNTMPTIANSSISNSYGGNGSHINNGNPYMYNGYGFVNHNNNMGMFGYQGFNNGYNNNSQFNPM